VSETERERGLAPRNLPARELAIALVQMNERVPVRHLRREPGRERGESDRCPSRDLAQDALWHVESAAIQSGGAARSPSTVKRARPRPPLTRREAGDPSGRRARGRVALVWNAHSPPETLVPGRHSPALDALISL
jgi:hypothetical protein